ncbi:KPN_02809 family neutral zinc metallopeptidase [Cellulomonas cellasea]|uniref:Membrane protein n=2 Tax=Cellulomonas cellasea TaxID=43670 RepID=A0A0A0BA44_9CELL|nr:neutral zinc metallopeptidase [Cellulomonas cellasea]KGM03033.1 membrane protein [Cellulomonas cellasea DSM 20118]GEA90197.1 membrane protein [Cellulomonas cellasea]
MTFSEGGGFEGGRVETSRGGRGAAVGGGVGLLGIAVFLIAQFTGVDLSGVVGGAQGGGAAEEVGTIGECSVDEANTTRECRLSGTVQSLDAYWAAALPAAGVEFVAPGVRAFQDSVGTGCGQASASTGPFYCPPDQKIYMDLRFFDLLQSQFGASGGELAEMYVTAHEYGHHIQTITGVMDRADRQGTGATSDSVRVELQADCYAGVWAGTAASTVDPDTGVPFLEPITDTQLADALSAAEAVGDDHIQEQSGGGVNPHTWTHGSSEQRQRWFTTGYNERDMAACDTFAATDL